MPIRVGLQRRKSRDHETVRAQKKCPEVVQRRFAKSCWWSLALEVVWSLLWSGSQPNVVSMDSYIRNQWLGGFGVLWSPGLNVLGLPPQGGFWIESKWPWNMIPCRKLCKRCVRLAFTYFVCPSSVVWSEVGQAPPFPPMRVLEVQWSRALNLVCEVALRSKTKGILRYYRSKAKSWIRLVLQ